MKIKTETETNTYSFTGTITITCVSREEYDTVMAAVCQAYEEVKDKKETKKDTYGKGGSTTSNF